MRTSFPGRYVKFNESCQRPGHVVFVDTETEHDPATPRPADAVEAHKLRLGVAVSLRWKEGKWCCRDECVFRSQGEFWAWLTPRLMKKKPCTVFAHNWHYDAQAIGLWTMLDKGYLKLSMPGKVYADLKTGEARQAREWRGLAVIGDSPFIVVACLAGHAVRFVDTYNYWPVPLAEIGRSFGLPKLDMPGPAEAEADLITYCRRDVAIIEHAVCSTMDAWTAENRGNWQDTAGALAMSNYRHRWMPDKIITHLDPDVKALERRSYFGGATRCWYRGRIEGPIFNVDVTSFYGAMMRNHTFPRRLVAFDESRFAGERFALRDPAACIADVVIDSPWRETIKRTGKIVSYPAGEFTTTLAGPELARAVRQGEVKAVSRWAEYELAPLFVGYVDYWWGVRCRALERGDSANVVLSKSMLNCLYGKFGARANVWQMMPEIKAPVRWGHFAAKDPESREWAEYRSIGGTVQISREGKEREDTLVAIAAFVTAYGREFMRLARGALPTRSCLAVRTDGMLLTAAGFEALEASAGLTDRELGRWRLAETYSALTIAAANAWRAPERVCMSGLGGVKRELGNGVYELRQPDRSERIIASGPAEAIWWRSRVARFGVDADAEGTPVEGWSDMG